jgi:citrate synthase
VPMAVAGLAAFLTNDLDFIPAFSGGNIFHGNVEKTDEAVLKTIVAFASVMGLAASHRRGIKFMPPSQDNTYLENLFIMMGIVDPKAGAPDPLHFGAPESAYKALKQIGKVENVPKFLDEVKSGKRRLFGYGHRTYKTVDPRLAPIKEALIELNVETDPLLRVAREIDRLSLIDDYFLSRVLHANADFYPPFSYVAI